MNEQCTNKVLQPKLLESDINRISESLFRLSTGNETGEVRSPIARAPVAMIAGGALLTVRPPAGRYIGADWTEWTRRLVALDLTAGDESWAQPLLDLTFRGPFPP